MKPVTMQPPATPKDEEQRMRALAQTGLLDTAPEERFDRVTRIAQTLFHVPIALVSLVDTERQWFKSRQGLDACETSRDASFCGHAVSANNLLIVNDTSKDSRFSDNPLVTSDPNIRFYAGAPVRALGQPLGTLCVIDRQPRVLSGLQQAMLKDLALIVEEEIARRVATRKLGELRGTLSSLAAELADFEPLT